MLGQGGILGRGVSDKLVFDHTPEGSEGKVKLLRQLNIKSGIQGRS